MLPFRCVYNSSKVWDTATLGYHYIGRLKQHIYVSIDEMPDLIQSGRESLSVSRCEVMNCDTGDQFFLHHRRQRDDGSPDSWELKLMRERAWRWSVYVHFFYVDVTREFQYDFTKTTIELFLSFSHHFGLLTTKNGGIPRGPRGWESRENMKYFVLNRCNE